MPSLHILLKVGDGNFFVVSSGYQYAEIEDLFLSNIIAYDYFSVLK